MREEEAQTQGRIITKDTVNYSAAVTWPEGEEEKFLGWLELETSCLSFCRENHQLFHANCHLGRFHPLQEKNSPANASGIISIY